MNHIAVKKPAPASNGNLVACGLCDMDIRTVTSFFLHWLDAHNEVSLHVKSLKLGLIFALCLIGLQ